MKTDPDKIEKIRSWPISYNLTDVRSFLSLCCYYKSIVDKFSDIAVPLYNLTKNIRFYWNTQRIGAFDTFKVTLQETVILQHPHFEQLFVLDTDAIFFTSGIISS